ncbi:MAG: hypothetical protein JXA10_18830 [Anaerolineae bacterium]|nr:hypothetical protein [Anaerolineae bacterium]
MNNSNPLSGEVWQRGSRLGLIWLAVFVIVGVVLYALMGVLGWSGALRAIGAMLAAPVVGGIGIALWWLIRRPALVRDDEGEQ